MTRNYMRRFLRNGALLHTLEGADARSGLLGAANAPDVRSDSATDHHRGRASRRTVLPGE
jgi:hypothetical protein